jgi:hypothetical protein
VIAHITVEQFKAVQDRLKLKPCVLLGTYEHNGRVVIKVAHLNLTWDDITATGLYVCPPDILENDG